MVRERSMEGGQWKSVEAGKKFVSDTREKPAGQGPSRPWAVSAYSD